MTYARIGSMSPVDVQNAMTAIVQRKSDIDGIVAGTSGSTGIPRKVILTAEAVRAAVRLTSDVLAGPGTWFQALPHDRIGGALIYGRSAYQRSAVVHLPKGGFTAEAFIEAVQRHPLGERSYISLVPTQLRRILTSPRATETLARFTTVLIGGAPIAQSQRQLAQDSNISIVSTYGATETAGGCVYDGLPLPGVLVKIDNGSVLLSGPMLASGYEDEDNSNFETIDGQRWYRTPDHGALVGGRLTIHGRADDVIITGGLKVAPSRVEAALTALEPSLDWVVVGVPDADLGERLVAVVNSKKVTYTRDELKELLPLEAYEVPFVLVPLVEIPEVAPGKIDRSLTRQLAMSTLSARRKK